MLDAADSKDILVDVKIGFGQPELNFNNRHWVFEPVWPNVQSEALKNYLRVTSRFHKYSWGNSLLIYSQRADATHVAGFHAWLKMRRDVRKGEKGIVILAPMVRRKKSDNQLTEDEQARVFGFRAAHIFDVSQTDGETAAGICQCKG